MPCDENNNNKSMADPIPAFAPRDSLMSSTSLYEINSAVKKFYSIEDLTTEKGIKKKPTLIRGKVQPP